MDEVIKAFGGGNARNMQIAVWKMSENYLQDENEVFRRNLIAVIAELSGEELAILAGIAEKTLEKEIRRRKRRSEEPEEE